MGSLLFLPAVHIEVTAVELIATAILRVTTDRNILRRTDGEIDGSGATIGVQSLQIILAMLVLGSLDKLTLIQVLSHLPKWNPFGVATTQAELDATDAGVFEGDNTELQMLLPATETGDSGLIFPHFLIVSLFIEHIGWDLSKKLPRRVITPKPQNPKKVNLVITISSVSCQYS